MEGWSFTEGSKQRKPTLRGSSQKRVYTSHIRGVSPTEAWKTDKRKSSLFLHGDALPQHPETILSRKIGTFAPCDALFTSGRFTGSKQKTTGHGAQEKLWEVREERLSSSETCFHAVKVTSFLDKPPLPLWSHPEPYLPFLHTQEDYSMWVFKIHIERDVASFFILDPVLTYAQVKCFICFRLVGIFFS